MIKLIASLSLVVSMSSFAAVLDVSDNTVAEAIDLGTCSLHVQNSPVLFGKNKSTVDVGGVRLWVRTVDANNVRQLDIGRTVHLKEVSSTLIISDDQSISLVYFGDTPNRVKVADVEPLSGGQLKLICVDDAPISF